MTLPDQYKKILLDCEVDDVVSLIGIRSKENKRGIYDDKIILITPDSVDEYKANTDPSVTRKGVAVLQPGVYLYKRGLHGISHLNTEKPEDKAIWQQLVDTGKDHAPIDGRILPYWALRQAGPVTIKRDGQTTTETEKDPSEWPWIDIHRGGYGTTSSLGCQTIFPDLWPSFRDKVFSALKKYGQEKVKYCLVQN